ncbi:MAG TPA: glycosyltransferase family 87 protein [Ktedonobacterales bacterium]
MRWTALVVLGALALPLYGRIEQVAGNFASQPGVLFWPLLGVTALSVAACWMVFVSRPAGSQAGRWLELALLLALGLAARAVFFGAPPTLSHDSYRYVWDAHLLTHGLSPYTNTPFSPSVQPFQDKAIWPNVRFRNSPTIYPPGAELSFLLIYWIKPLSMGALKSGLEIADGLVAVLTMLLLRRHKLDTRRVILYWWSPIPVIEFAFSAHLDVEAIVWTLAALLVAGCRWRGARLTAGILLGMGTLTKFYPALFSVVMVRKRRDWVVLAGLVGTMALGYAAFWKYQAQSGGFLSTYIGQSTFDRGLLLRYINTAVTLVGGNQTLVIALQLLALAGLCLLVGWYCWGKGLRMEAGVLAINVVWILVATHIFTWYIAVLLPLLALYLRLGPGTLAVETAPKGVPPPPLAAGGRPSPPSRTRTKAGERADQKVEQAVYPTDLSGRYATPALGIWFFALAMPFTYVYFASGAFHSDYFKYSFYLSFAIAALPLLTRQGRAALRLFLRFSAKPAISLADPIREEYPHAIDSTEPSAGQPTWQWRPNEQRDRSAATRAVSGDD